jgi:hypothetical protein
VLTHISQRPLWLAVLVFVAGCAPQLPIKKDITLRAISAEPAEVFAAPATAAAAPPPACPASINSLATKPLAHSTPADGACVARKSHGYLIPDRKCTPGAINPTLTLAVLNDEDFRTGCVRDNLTTPTQKHGTYDWYSVQPPSPNNASAQVCELDHLIPLVIGGADSLDNIWPQCGPADVTLRERYFKQKDCVEVYLGDQVRAGNIKLSTAQKGIAKDWTKYLAEAETSRGKPCEVDINVP